MEKFKVDPVEYGRHVENVEAGLEVDHTDGGIEVNNEHDGIEVNGHSGHRHGQSIEISPRIELSSTRLRDEAEDVPPLEPRTCGLKRPWFGISVASVTLIVIGGLIGGLVGSMAKQDTSTPSPTSFPSSNLAAVNWTTAGNETSYVVFMQDADLSLIAYTGNTDTWTKVNITEKFEDSGLLAVRAGTPLAAVAMSDLENITDRQANQLNLFFLTPENRITQIITHDATLKDWNWGSIGPNSDVSITTAPGSQLAAVWVRCDNFTDCAMNSSISLISMSYGNYSDYAWGFFDTNGILGSAWQDYQNGNWWWSDQGRNILSNIQPSTLQQFAATSFSDRQHAFIAALFPDGSVIGKHWDPTLNDWHDQAELKLLDNPQANFSTIAMTADVRFYGIANSSIQEYQMDSEDPYTFHWLGKVL
ncbi:hypothetical protein BJ170DRAFT_180085 [Xylariales sp. AK1849]|nr:hypothetical protein BJ170DRAFT_180085 [Xylariales sp. AK1849]